jgi:hypothetical protein
MTQILYPEFQGDGFLETSVSTYQTTWRHILTYLKTDKAGLSKCLYYLATKQHGVTVELLCTEDVGRIDYISASCSTVFNASICNIYSLKMQPFSLFHTVVTTLHVSATHRHPQVRLH